MTRTIIPYMIFIGDASLCFRSFLLRVINQGMEKVHRSVMVNEVFEYIKLINGGTYADLTFGEGGHSEIFLNSPIAQLFATDRDSTAVEMAKRLPKWKNEPRLQLFNSEFSKFPELVGETKFDAILIDLGVSTRQLLEPERGFSLFTEGPLDMRMDPAEGTTLKEILESIETEELADALHRYADLNKSRSTARRIIEGIKTGRIQTTKDLSKMMGPLRYGKSHPATALFLALRMLVNQELEQIEVSIPRLIPLLKPRGRLVILTFHSTEDRCVKKIFRSLAGHCICEKDLCTCPRIEQVKILTTKPVPASEIETKENPRARSAKLRAIEKI